MQRSPSLEANQFSASKEIPPPPHCLEPEGLLPLSKVPAISPYLEPAQSRASPHILIVNIILPSKYQSRSQAVGDISQQDSFYSEDLLAPRPTPKLEDYPCRLFTTVYSIYSRLPSILEALPPFAT
jgi:hypothetical protein